MSFEFHNVQVTCSLNCRLTKCMHVKRKRKFYELQLKFTYMEIKNAPVEYVRNYDL